MRGRGAMLFVVLLLSAVFAALPARAQESTATGMAVLDITYDSGCTLTYRTLSEDGPEGEVLDETAVDCPAGTVLHSVPATEEEAANLGAIFVPFTGDDATDAVALEQAKQSLQPTDGWSYSAAQNEAARGCNDASFSAGLSYYAYDPGVTVYVTVYYAQDYTCAAWISSATGSASWNADIWWRRAGYSYPFGYRDHGCVNLSTGGYWHSFNGWSVYGLGGIYYDEAINAGWDGCWEFGETYTGSVYL